MNFCFSDENEKPFPIDNIIVLKNSQNDFIWIHFYFCFLQFTDFKDAISKSHLSQILSKKVDVSKSC